MKIKLTTIGNTEIEFDAPNEQNAIAQLAFWQGLPTACGICAKPLIFQSRQPQGYTYYGLICTGSPRHESNFGQHKEGGGLFFKADWRDVQYNSVQSESAAEISQYDEQPKPIAVRISGAQKAIRDLGGKVEPIGQFETDADYFNSLNEQYKRLKAR